MTLAYMEEPWFALLQSRAAGQRHTQVARLLGISTGTLSQVLNGTGLYGEGKASTARVANKVLHTFGRYPCPHLTEEAGGVPQEITAEQCRARAHGPVPTTPSAARHWQACRQCPHRDASAPPVDKPVVARKRSGLPVSPVSGDEHGSSV
jgi:hypothetical protein